MRRNKSRKIAKVTASLLCAVAIVLGSIPDVWQAAAAGEEPGYIEKEIAAGANINSQYDSPEIIPVNTLCEGTIGGECANGDNDWEDTYQPEMDSGDFTKTKRGRFHIELTLLDAGTTPVSLNVMSSDDATREYYSGETSSKIVTPTYSRDDTLCIAIGSRAETKVTYHLKVVYDTLENNESGQWAETERNSLPDNAAEIQVNQNYWGCLQDELASHPLWYQYTLAQPGTVKVTLEPQDGKRQNAEDLWQMYVYTVSGDSEGDSERYLSGTSASGVQSKAYQLDAGTYYIQIYTFEETAVGQIYSLRVDYDDGTQPTPTVTPEVTEEPKATETPDATGTPEATGTPDTTGTPDATGTPKPTEKPGASENPKASETPDTTESPEATGTPDTTGTPKPTEMPEVTKEPGTTEKPKTPASSQSSETPAASGTSSAAAAPGTSGTLVTTTTTAEQGSTTIQKEIKEITNTKVIHITLKVSSKKSIALKWKKNKAAQGYKIYRSTKKKKGFRCVKTIKNKNTIKWKDTKVRKGKVYYYKLRAYKKVGKKMYYSKYTKTLMAKVK